VVRRAEGRREKAEGKRINYFLQMYAFISLGAKKNIFFYVQYYCYFSYLCRMEKILELLRKIEPILNEKQRRIVFAVETEQLGKGGKSKISALTGMSRSTLNAGFKG